MELNMIKTTKEINIAHYSEKQPHFAKLMFKGIKPVNDDPKEEEVAVIYSEFEILGDPVVKQTKKFDENGMPVLDENGDPVMETKTIENIKFLRTIKPFKVPYAMWFALKRQVESQLPASMSDADKYKAFLIEGVKQTIVSGGWYQGQLTLQDFE